LAIGTLIHSLFIHQLPAFSHSPSLGKPLCFLHGFRKLFRHV
jgi:hypothetical protein